MSAKIRVLVVDDSALMRKILNQAFENSGDFEVVGLAADPFEARNLLLKHKPDIMTLDLDMPKMDGLTFLEKVMTHLPTRVVVISAFAQSGSHNAISALELGAVEVVEKPSLAVLKDPVLLEAQLLSKIRAVSSAQARRLELSTALIQKVERKDLNPKIHLIAIAASTGGTQAIRELFDRLPDCFPPVVVVQHMPAGFTKNFADNLNKRYRFGVKEAVHGEKLVPSQVYIAPGDFHMEIRGIAGSYSIYLHQQEPKHSVRPAADYLLGSVAKFAGSHSIGVILTGMGKDGAIGLLEMKKKGAHTIAQSENTCIVYGMPAAAVSLGAVEESLDLGDIAKSLVDHYLLRRVA